MVEAPAPSVRTSCENWLAPADSEQAKKEKETGSAMDGVAGTTF